MIDGALPYLRCPVCADTLCRSERTLRCPRGHSFDLARQGYANLTTGRSSHVGDTADMVADRAAFLAAGHYDFIAAALARSLPHPLRQPPTPAARFENRGAVEAAAEDLAAEDPSTTDPSARNAGAGVGAAVSGPRAPGAAGAAAAGTGAGAGAGHVGAGAAAAGAGASA